MSQPRLALSAVLAKELHAKPAQVEAAIRLLDEGATVPFIARYRKEATQGLNDNQLRRLVDRLEYLRELDERRHFILEAIRATGQLTSKLEEAILSADTKTRLEDLYLPYRPKRRTKAQMAREAGFEPLALDLLNNPSLDVKAQAKAFLNIQDHVADVDSALEGARHILLECFSEAAELISELRQYVWENGVLQSRRAKADNASLYKYADYFEFAQPIRDIPSHRALALFRGRREGVLRLSLILPETPEHGVRQMAAFFKLPDTILESEGWLKDTLYFAWKTKVFPKLELELFARLREHADEEAIKVFASNLRDLLLAAPAGYKVVMGLDPGIRSGTKVVVIDATGKLLDSTVIFPLPPNNQWHESLVTLAKLAAKYHVELVSIGNGTASRETERLISDMIKMYPDLHLNKVIVSEAGASVYSASKLAAEEYPDLDVTLRGALSIARRVQDPLSELVKIEPKSIGVGQYQHDVNQSRLARCLETVVEDCVNAVGVDVNTASAVLLKYVAGFSDTLAHALVQYRDAHGAFQNREQLKQVPRLGDKTFQQSAGFLRIFSGDNALDTSAVHPEAYPLVERMVSELKVELSALIGNHEQLKAIRASDYLDEQFGLPTIMDVLHELEKPGRDPRPEFKIVRFKEGIEVLDDLQEGMLLEGVVGNVTNFGAFVDVGVHQDGLVHISEMTNRFVKDPRTVLKTGDIVKVKVIEVDKKRRRIGLSMKLEQVNTPTPVKSSDKCEVKPKKSKKHESSSNKKPLFNTAMADALAKLKQGIK